MKIKLGWVLFAAFFLYFVFLLRSDIIRFAELKKQHLNLLRKIEHEADWKKQLDLKITRLQQNTSIEQLARKKLGMIKSGENLYKIE